MNPAPAPPSAAEPPTLLGRADVAAALDIPLKTLTWWIWGIGEDRRYTSFEVSRRNGAPPRVIRAPIKPLKDIQQRLASMLLDCYTPSTHVHGFVTDRSPVTNARIHLRKQWLLRVDLHDFFPSINFGRVRGMFMAYPFHYPPDVATLLAHICCYRNQLPQGAPTSPVVSNYICRGMDRSLSEVARAERCHYSRYADDLCFSTDRTVFPQVLGSIEAGAPTAGVVLNEVIEANGFRVNPAKTRLMRRTQRQRVTGLVVNDKVNVSRHYVKSLRNLLYVWRRYGEVEAMEAFERTEPHPNWPPDKPRPAFRKVVRGRVQHVGSIKGWSNPVYVRLASALSDLDEDFKPSHSLPAEATGVSVSKAPHVVRLFTEGDTDLVHLAAALQYFNGMGEFTDFAFVINDDSSLNGDDLLLKFGKALSRMPQSQPCVLVFDRDKPTIRTSATDDNDWKSLGNGVVNVVIAPPAWRAEADLICIEMLHSQEVLLREDQEGRRVFLFEEFDDDSGVHLTTREFNIPNAKNSTLVQERVFEVATGKSVGLGKTAFATAVGNAADPYGGIDFEGFRPTFEVLRQAINAAAANVEQSGQTPP